MNKTIIISESKTEGIIAFDIKFSFAFCCCSSFRVVKNEEILLSMFERAISMVMNLEEEILDNFSINPSHSREVVSSTHHFDRK